MLYNNDKLMNLVISYALSSENGKIRSASIYLYNSIIYQNNTICNNIITQLLHDNDENNISISDDKSITDNYNYIKVYILLFIFIYLFIIN